MIGKIHVHPKVEKLIGQMEMQEKAPSIAAGRARAIIQSLLEGAAPTHAGRLSKKKDARIKNLFKFDLGSGYRLICVKEKLCLHILHIGSHDNCDTWLDANSRKKPHKTEVCMNVYCVETPVADQEEEGGSDGQKEDLFPVMQISQEDLKNIFKGLVSGL